MQLCLHMDEGPLYLFVPTYYDAEDKEWMGLVHLPKAKRMIYGRGKNSTELEHSFNSRLKEFMHSEFAEETFGLFKPLSYWEEMYG